MKLLFPLLVFCAPLGVPAQESNRTVLTPQLINELAEEARTNNSALWAAHSRLNAAEQNARSIPLWRDPEFTAGGMIAESMMRAEDGDIMYGVEQALPLFGKEKAMRNAAAAEIPVEQANVELKFQTLRKELAEALFKAALQDELLLIAQQDLVWLNTLATGVEQRYQAGDASQVDVLRVQNERSKRIEQLTTDENSRENAYVTVNRLLNRNVHAVWAALRLPELAPAILYHERLIRIATTYEPRLKLIRREVARAEAMANATRKGKRPDVSVGLEGRQFSETGDPRSATVLLKLSLPWLNRDKYRAAIARDEAKVQEIQNMLDDYHYELRAELHHLTAKIDAARRDALLYRNEIVPRSQQALESAQAAWQSNRDAFRDVLDARRMLLDAQTMYHRAVAEQYMALSELVLCCGIGDLEALDMLVQPEREDATEEKQ